MAPVHAKTTRRQFLGVMGAVAVAAMLPAGGNATTMTVAPLASHAFDQATGISIRLLKSYEFHPTAWSNRTDWIFAHPELIVCG